MTADLPDPVRRQIDTLRSELDELAKSDAWRQRENARGSRQLRSIAIRIALSARRLEEFVKENTFHR